VSTGFTPRKRRKKQFVSCSEHGDDVLGYIVCKHVIGGFPVGSIERPKPGRVGSLVCVLKSAEEHATDELSLMCGECADTNGYTVAHHDGVLEVPG